ncbi:MAG: hypothetical protein R3F43_08530 [bacterium]
MRLLVFLLLINGLAWAGEHPFGLPELTVFSAAAGRRVVSIRVAPRPGAEVPTAPVAFTAEPLALADVPLPAWLAEADVLGSGRAVDLDGDGKLTGRWPIRCMADSLAVGDTIVRGVGWDRFRYPRAIPRVTPAGAGVVLYGACGPRITVGFGAGAVPVESMPGPLLQVSVVERTGADGPPKLGLRDWKLDNEKIVRLRSARIQAREAVAGEPPEWLTVHWVLVPVPAKGSHLVDFVIDGEGPGLVFAAVNVAEAPDTRWRGPINGRPLP